MNSLDNSCENIHCATIKVSSSITREYFFLVINIHLGSGSFITLQGWDTILKATETVLKNIFYLKSFVFKIKFHFFKEEIISKVGSGKYHGGSEGFVGQRKARIKGSREEVVGIFVFSHVRMRGYIELGKG